MMVIDDEPIVGKRLKRVFEKEGFDVQTFTDSLTAVKALETTHYDIIITDLKMEGIDGMKILEIVREQYQDTRVFIITGYGKRATDQEALKKGASGFLIKPFRIEELKQVIRKAVSDSGNQ
jgi:DNA-binding NtrC family response regulator